LAQEGVLSRDDAFEYLANSREAWKSKEEDKNDDTDTDDEDAAKEPLSELVEKLDATVFGLIEALDANSDDLPQLLDEALKGSLWARQIAEANQSTQTLHKAILEARAQLIWANTTPQSRKGHFAMGVGLEAGLQLDALATKMSALIDKADDAALSGDENTLAKALIKLAGHLLKIRPFTPAKKAPDCASGFKAPRLFPRRRLANGLLRKRLTFGSDFAMTCSRKLAASGTSKKANAAWLLPTTKNVPRTAHIALKSTSRPEMSGYLHRIIVAWFASTGASKIPNQVFSSLALRMAINAPISSASAATARSGSIHRSSPSSSKLVTVTWRGSGTRDTAPTSCASALTVTFIEAGQKDRPKHIQDAGIKRHRAMTGPIEIGHDLFRRPLHFVEWCCRFHQDRHARSARLWSQCTSSSTGSSMMS
jgi:hypothetical protein